MSGGEAGGVNGRSDEAPLPPGAVDPGPPPSIQELEELMRRLEAAGVALRARPVAEIVEALGRVGERTGTPGAEQDALAARVASETGFSPEQALRVVRGMARDWTRARLETLVAAEFPEPSVLDRFTTVPLPASGAAVPGDSPHLRRLRAQGDPVAFHVGSGSVPGVSATSMIRSLLVKTPVLVKPGRGDRALTAAFHAFLEEEDRELAASAAVRYWGGGATELEAAVLRGAHRVVAYGSDESVESLRRRLPVHVPLVAYHHRSSVAVVGAAATRSDVVADTARDLVRAASAFDQRGCVSPHRVYLLGDHEAASRLAEALAVAWEEESRRIPPGRTDAAEKARVQQLRGDVELRGAAGEPVGVWTGPGTSWTVILETAERISPYGGPRTLQIAALQGIAQLVDALAEDAGHLQNAGVAGLQAPEEVVEALAGAGVTRIAPLSEMAFPPAWWLHDGAGPLRSLVRWTEWSG